MVCQEIMEKIEASYAKEYALEWDNVGLLVGRDDKEVKKIYIALDATDEVIANALEFGADMLITHHPLLFSPIKRITSNDFIGRRIIQLIQNDISYYAAHTNYDVLGMSDLSGTVLGLENLETLEITAEEGDLGIGKVAKLESPVSLGEFSKQVKDRFHLGSVKVFGDLKDTVSVVAISPGSGSSMIRPAIKKGADVLITGDIDHHTGIDALDQGLRVIDAGHYGIEHIFIEDMKEFILQQIPEVIVATEPLKSPFIIV
ncbi:dinuclear metal center YbgI/SA1388 family protein [Lachnospiraceae bacterium PF1-22]|uniref:Nif3-like dinuclear metal center hexameric protein n=1 Tax=Ohessyouella blattaphilus TaxID=2949333 RepID=UPI003E1E0B05